MRNCWNCWNHHRTAKWKGRCDSLCFYRSSIHSSYRGLVQTCTTQNQVAQLLIPRAPGVPRSCRMGGCATSTKIGSWFQSLYLQKGIRTGCPDAPSDGFVSHGKRGRYESVGIFLSLRRLPSSSCGGLYIVSGVLFLSLMAGRYFMLSWWH